MYKQEKTLNTLNNNGLGIGGRIERGNLTRNEEEEKGPKELKEKKEFYLIEPSLVQEQKTSSLIENATLKSPFHVTSELTFG